MHYCWGTAPCHSRVLNCGRRERTPNRLSGEPATLLRRVVLATRPVDVILVMARIEIVMVATEIGMILMTEGTLAIVPEGGGPAAIVPDVPVPGVTVLDGAPLAVMVPATVEESNPRSVAHENRVISTKYGDWKCVTGERVVLSV